jgi:hypothetical protein
MLVLSKKIPKIFFRQHRYYVWARGQGGSKVRIPSQKSTIYLKHAWELAFISFIIQ